MVKKLKWVGDLSRQDAYILHEDDYVLFSSMFYYEEDSGNLFWKALGKGRIKKKAAGTITSSGYVGILVNGVRYYAHRIVWLLKHRTWPKDQIDHINGIKTDNRISNLRAATNSQNGKNYGKNKANTSGVTGVSFCKQTGKWRATIKIDHKAKSLGRFIFMEDAIKARHAAEIKYFNEWRRVA